MKKLQEIQAPIAKELDAFQIKFRESTKSQVALLSLITRYILKKKGKQMRPTFVFLSAGIFGKPNESTDIAASLVELLHTATLVHDDVVDDAQQRRGLFSINALWKNKIAVLIGDYLLSKGLLIALEKDEFQLLKIVSNAVKEMSEGELLQIEKARHLDITESIYFDIIRKKTASLIASACATGAASVTKDQTLINKMHYIGELIGIAFQIKDDIFDYQKINKTGKPSGIDLKEQKMTLPFIHMLQQVDELERRKYLRIVKHHSNNPKKVQQLIDVVNQNGGIEYAIEKMTEYQQKAIHELASLPENDCRRSLENLLYYSTSREN